MRSVVQALCACVLGLSGAGVASAGFGGVQGDDCDFPLPLDCNATVHANLGSMTSDPLDPSFTCRVPTAGRGVNTIWYRFVAGGTEAKLTTGLVTGGAANDTLLAVYSGSCSQLTQIACNDDIGNGNLLSSVTLTNLVENDTYFVQLAAYSAADVGVYSLNLDCRPSYDECAGALTVTCNSAVDVNLGICTTNPADPIFPCRSGNPTTLGLNSAWVRFVAGHPNMRLTTVATNGAPNHNTLMNVFIGTGCGGLNLFACNDDFDSSGLSQLILNGIEVGREFWVQVAAASPADVDRYRVLLDCDPGCADCAQGAVQEGEPCGFSFNGPCTAGTPVSCAGANICGQLSPSSNFAPADVDLYSFTLESNAVINWCLVSPQRVEIAIVANPFCEAGGTPVVFAFESLNQCEVGCVQAVVPPGNYMVGVALNGNTTSCGAANHYAGTLSTSILCPGDVNLDNRVDTGDLVLLLVQFGQPVFSDCAPIDLARDGQIDTRDLVELLLRFGRLCLPPPPPPKP